MMLYEIVNPSDAYTMASEFPQAAEIASLFLGQGAYPLNARDGTKLGGFYAFGGDPEKDIKEKYGTTIGEYLESNWSDVVAALRSVEIGSFSDRDTVDDARSKMNPEDFTAWNDKRTDKQRSSMNNIGKRSRQLADAFEDKYRKAPHA